MEEKRPVGLSRYIKQAIEGQRLFSETLPPIGDVRIFSYLDGNVLYSLRNSEKAKVKKWSKLIVLHLFMVINPKPGMDYTIHKNRHDVVKNWFEPILGVLREANRNFTDALPALSTNDEKSIIDALKDKHQYNAIKVPKCYLGQIYCDFIAAAHSCVSRKRAYTEDELYEIVDSVVAQVKSRPMQKEVIVK